MPNQDWWIVFKTKKEGNAPKELSNDLKEVKAGVVGAIEGFTGLSMSSLGLAGMITGVGVALKESIDFTVKYAEQVGDLSRITGASADESSRLIQVADDLKIDYGTLTQAAKTLAKDGIALTTEELAKASDQYLAFGTAGERAKYATDKFGKSGLELTKILEQGGDAIRAMVAEQNGSLILTDAQVKSARELEKAQDGLTDAFDGLKVALASGVIPTLTSLLKVLTGVFETTEQMAEIQKGFTGILKDHDNVMRKEAQTYEEYRKEMERAAEVAGWLVDEEGRLYQIWNTRGGAVRKYTDDMKIATRAELEWDQAAQNAVASGAMYTAMARDAAEKTNALAASSTNAGAMYTAMAEAYENEALLKAQQDMDLVTGSMTKLTSAAIFQKAALSMDAEAALALGVSLGLVDQSSYDASKAIEEWQTQLRNGEIDQARYNQLVGDLARSWGSINSKDVSLNIAIAYKTTGLMPGQQPVIDPNMPIERYATGGSYVVPPGHYEDWPVGPNHVASSGETVTVTPKGEKGTGGGVVIENVTVSNSMDLESFKRMLMQVVGK